MRRYIFTLLIILSFLRHGFGQIVVDGFVYDAGTKETIIGATVSTSANSGTVTNTSGYFHLKSEKGSSLRVSYLGYQPLIIPLENIREDTTLTILLVQEVRQLREVQILAPASREDDAWDPNIASIPLEQTGNFPALAGEADPIRYLQSLPGISQGREGRSDLHVRGGSPDQNLLLIDGMPVFSIQHVGGLLSVLDPNSLKSIKLYKGGFPAKYGGRLSSVVDISLKDGDKSQTRKYVDVGVISTRFAIEGPLKKDKSSYLFSLRRANTDLFTSAISLMANDGKFRAGYTFYDFIGKVNFRPTSKDQVSFTFYGGLDRIFGVAKTSEEIGKDTFDLKMRSKIDLMNLLGVVNWTHISKKNHFRHIMLGFSRHQLHNGYQAERKSKDENTLIDFTKSSFYGYANDIRAAVNYEVKLQPAIQLNYGLQSSFQKFLPGMFEENQFGEHLSTINRKFGSIKRDLLEVSAYADAVITHHQLEINPGLRTSWWFNLYNKPHLEPRLLLTYHYNNNAISASAAGMRQSLHLLSNNSAGVPVDLWVPATQNIRPMKSFIYAIGYAKNTSQYLLQLGSYYKTYQNVIEFQEGKSFFGDKLEWSEKVESNGKGKSYGAEFLLRKKTGRINGWVSYTYSRSLRRFENISEGNWFPYRYDRPHNFTIFADFRIKENISFGTTWTYASGDAITLPIRKYPLLTLDQQRVNYRHLIAYDLFPAHLNSKRNGYRVPATHRLDINFSFVKERKKFERTCRFGVYNAYNRINPYYVYFDKNKEGNIKLYKAGLLPIFPYFSWSFKI